MDLEDSDEELVQPKLESVPSFAEALDLDTLDGLCEQLDCNDDPAAPRAPGAAVAAVGMETNCMGTDGSSGASETSDVGVRTRKRISFAEVVPADSPFGEVDFYEFRKTLAEFSAGQVVVCERERARMLAGAIFAASGQQDVKIAQALVLVVGMYLATGDAKRLLHAPIDDVIEAAKIIRKCPRTWLHERKLARFERWLTTRPAWGNAVSDEAANKAVLSVVFDRCFLECDGF
jgi:hypothetical protein